MKKVKKTKNTRGTAMGIGAGLAAAGAAAGYYFYGSKGAKKHRKVAMKFATTVKKQVVKEAKRLEKENPKVKNAIREIVSRAKKTVR